MHKRYKVLAMLAAVMVVSGCTGTWTSASVEPATGVSTTQNTDSKVVDPATVFVTKEDITDRKYTVVADIEATVNKTTIFHDDPTPAMVDEKLREEAAKLGADAVILVRYGTIGVSLVSWGSLDGRGRAVAFKN